MRRSRSQQCGFTVDAGADNLLPRPRRYVCQRPFVVAECGVDSAKVRELLAVTSEGNAGNAVTKDMKLYAKYAAHGERPRGRLCVLGWC